MQKTAKSTDKTFLADVTYVGDVATLQLYNVGTGFLHMMLPKHYSKVRNCWSYSVAGYNQGAVSGSRTTERWSFDSTRQVTEPADIILAESKSITCSFSTSACGWAARRRVRSNFRFVGGADAQSNYVSAHSCRPGLPI